MLCLNLYDCCIVIHYALELAPLWHCPLLRYKIDFNNTTSIRNIFTLNGYLRNVIFFTKEDR
jgi:hypothetical protein